MQRLLSLVLVTALLLAGCGSKEAGGSTLIYSPTPEAAVEGLIAAINTGEYAQAARYRHGAPELWQNNPGLWKFIIESLTAGQEITRFELTDSIRKQDAATLAGLLHRTDNSRRIVRFELVKRSGGWLFVEF